MNFVEIQQKMLCYYIKMLFKKIKCSNIYIFRLYYPSGDIIKKKENLYNLFFCSALCFDVFCFVLLVFCVGNV